MSPARVVNPSHSATFAGDVIKLTTSISKGLIRDARGRRLLMFYGVLTALALLFAGSTFLAVWLRERPLLFVVYWAVCAWFTFFDLLLALFDMLLMRRAAREEKRRLAEKVLSEQVSSTR